MRATDISLFVPPKYGVPTGLGLLPHRSTILACSELTACWFSKGGSKYKQLGLELRNTRTCCVGMRDPEFELSYYNR